MTLLRLGAGLPVAVSSEGHVRADGDVGDELVYVIQTATGQQTLSLSEFEQKYGWKNDPSKVRLPEP
jgi:hypothetical protein